MRRAVHALRHEIDSDPHRLSLQVLNKGILLLLENQVELTTRLARIEAVLEPPGSRRRIQLTPNDLRSLPLEEQAEKLELLDQESNAPKAPKATDEAMASDLKRQDDSAEIDSESRRSSRSVNVMPAAIDEDVIEEVTNLDLLDSDENHEEQRRDQKQAEESWGSGAFPELKPVAQIVAKVAIRAFDKRDNMFERGLELLKRWAEIDPKLPGTPFQMRPSQGFAYVNVLGLSAEKIKQRERIVKQQGYDLLLGRLTDEDFNGDIWLYQKSF